MPSDDTRRPVTPPVREASRAAADLGLLSPSWTGSAAAEATGDAAYLRAMLDAEAALTRAQAALGLAPRDAATAVTEAAAAAFDAGDLALRARSAGNPVVPLVADLTAAVADRDPQAAAYVHRGATSQDILDTATMLVCARALDAVLADLAHTAAALRRTAAAHRDTPMAGRTLTQHAVPTTFGLKAAGWRALVLDAHDRLTAVRAALPAQLGGAAGTLAAFHAFAEADDVEANGPEGGAEANGSAVEGAPDLGGRLLAAYAAETGLTEPALPWHTLRTPIADLAGALAFTAGALGKMAADVLTLTRTEIGEVAEGTGGGSSAMPHKANPVRATLIAATARQVPAQAAVLHGALAAEDERPAGAWHAEWQPLREALRLVGGAARDAAELTAGLRVFPDRMRQNLAATGGLITTERLAAALTALTGRGEARRILDAAARRTAQDGVDLHDALRGALADHPAAASALPEERLRRLLDPTDYPGSAARLVDRALARPESDPQEPA